jgi:hypothetical protein
MPGALHEDGRSVPLVRMSNRADSIHRTIWCGTKRGALQRPPLRTCPSSSTTSSPAPRRGVWGCRRRRRCGPHAHGFSNASTGYGATGSLRMPRSTTTCRVRVPAMPGAPLRRSYGLRRLWPYGRQRAASCTELPSPVSCACIRGRVSVLSMCRASDLRLMAWQARDHRLR